MTFGRAELAFSLSRLFPLFFFLGRAPLFWISLGPSISNRFHDHASSGADVERFFFFPLNPVSFFDLSMGTKKFSSTLDPTLRSFVPPLNSCWLIALVEELFLGKDIRILPPLQSWLWPGLTTECSQFKGRPTTSFFFSRRALPVLLPSFLALTIFSSRT